MLRLAAWSRYRQICWFRTQVKLYTNHPHRCDIFIFVLCCLILFCLKVNKSKENNLPQLLQAGSNLGSSLIFGPNSVRVWRLSINVWFFFDVEVVLTWFTRSNKREPIQSFVLFCFQSDTLRKWDLCLFELRSAIEQNQGRAEHTGWLVCNPDFCWVFKRQKRTLSEAILYVEYFLLEKVEDESINLFSLNGRPFQTITQK